MTRVILFNYAIDALRMSEAIDLIHSWIEEDLYSCRFVVTPNVNHTVLLQEHANLQSVYKEANLVLADGFPLIVVSRLLKLPLPERVAGSELIPKLFEAALPQRRLKVFLLGAAEHVGERAAKVIHSTYPGVEVVGTFSPPFGFENSLKQNSDIIRRVNCVQPDILIIGLGAPKQELWVHKHRKEIKTKVAFCVGATIDFIAGEKRQAPIWMRRAGLEWIHRILSEPRRLLGRYVHDARLFPQLVWAEWRKERRETTLISLPSKPPRGRK